MTSEQPLDQQTLETIAEMFQKTAADVINSFAEKIQELDNRIESIDKQIATLIVGYGEQAVFMEALVAQLAFATDDQRKSFNDSLNEARKKMLEVMRDASATNLADEDPNTAAAVEELVAQKLSETES